MAGVGTVSAGQKFYLRDRKSGMYIAGPNSSGYLRETSEKGNAQLFEAHRCDGYGPGDLMIKVYGQGKWLGCDYHHGLACYIYNHATLWNGPYSDGDFRCSGATGNSGRVGNTRVCRYSKKTNSSDWYCGCEGYSGYDSCTWEAVCTEDRERSGGKWDPSGVDWQKMYGCVKEHQNDTIISFPGLYQNYWIAMCAASANPGTQASTSCVFDPSDKAWLGSWMENVDKARGHNLYVIVRPEVAKLMERSSLDAINSLPDSAKPNAKTLGDGQFMEMKSLLGQSQESWLREGGRTYPFGRKAHKVYTVDVFEQMPGATAEQRVAHFFALAARGSLPAPFAEYDGRSQGYRF